MSNNKLDAPPAPPAPTSEERKKMVRWLDEHTMVSRYDPKLKKTVPLPGAATHDAIRALILSAPPKVVSREEAEKVWQMAQGGFVSHAQFIMWLCEKGIAVEPEEGKK